MNFDFYTEHIQTLADLQKLAEKHNCKIAFGFTSGAFDEDEKQDLLDILGCKGIVREEIDNEFSLSLKQGAYTKVYFELYDRTKDTYNVLTYYEHELLVSLENKSSFYPQYSDETEQWLEENKTDWSYDINDCYIFNETSKEEVRGFKGVKKEWNIYRPGIMLAVFAQLVCDYLGEERIVRSY